MGIALKLGRLAVAIFSVWAIGCTYVNQRLNPPDMPVGQQKTNGTMAGLALCTTRAKAGDRWFVGLAISGGGSRSANFSAAVMFELQRIGLLDRVDAISAVSGGSLTAAYYCVAKDEDWNPGNVQRKLSHPFASDMWWRAMQPWIVGAMLFSDYDRSDILAHALNRTLFTRGARTLTYGDLRADRPRLLLNSTDLQSARRFVFCNESFDEINSDLSRFPIAYAAAASSSVPIVLHHVTLRDFSTIFKQYRHFVDGGVVDNLGIQTLVEAYQRSNDQAGKQGLAAPYDKGAVLIVIDAGTQFNAKLSDRGDVGFFESLGTGAKLTSTLLQRASSATLLDVIMHNAPPDSKAQDIAREYKQLEETGILESQDAEGKPLIILHIAISRAAGLKEAPYQAFSQSLEAVPTYFNITNADAHALYLAAKLIIRERFEPQLEKIRTEVSPSRVESR